MRINDYSITTNRKEVQTTLEGLEAVEDWSFTKADTSYMTHGLHEYPARMIPQIAQKLLRLYTNESDRVLDPFCGSGTTLVEARLARRHAVGVDINPLALLIAKVKSTPIYFEDIRFDVRKFIESLETDYLKTRASNILPEIPNIIPNLLHWFKTDVARTLEFLYNKIIEVDDENIKDLLKVVFSDTVFACSNIDRRSSRFIRVRKASELKQFNPNVINIFRDKLVNAVSRVVQFTHNVGKLDVEVKVIKGDARKLMFIDQMFDSIITSPPYGEEKNTIDYHRWSKLSIAWLRLDNVALKELEKISLGSMTSKNPKEDLEKLPSPTAVNLLKSLYPVDEKRMAESLPYFFDYLQSLREMYRVLTNGGYACIVIGNRSIRRKYLDMGEVTIELGNEVGFRHVKTYTRNIPIKLIPWTTPTGKTISRENIVILQKV